MTRVALLFGGISTEHDISCTSADNVINALNDRFDLVLIGITREGRWVLCPSGTNVTGGAWEADDTLPSVVVLPGRGLAVVGEKDACDAVFPHLRWAALYKDWDGPAEGERPHGYVVICVPEGLADNAIRLIDVGIAAQTMALAAAARGLGCCMLRSFDSGLADVLKLPEGLVPALVIAIGGRGERVVLEWPDTEHGLTYWREPDGTHCVPKLRLEDLLV